MSTVLHAANLNADQRVRHGFFTRAWGNCGLSVKFDASEQATNRARVAADLGVPPDNLLSCYQIHSADVVTVTKLWKADRRPKADAMVTKERGIALGILTADCVPVLFADPYAGVVGGAHAGWRGALTGVLEKTIVAMEALGAQRKAIQAALGPCIWQNSYEVGPEFPAPFLAENRDYQRFFRAAFRSDHTLFDLPGYVETKLRLAGLRSIEGSPGDTLTGEDRFFSYRRNCLKGVSRTESLISVIVLAN